MNIGIWYHTGMSRLKVQTQPGTVTIAGLRFNPSHPYDSVACSWYNHQWHNRWHGSAWRCRSIVYSADTSEAVIFVWRDWQAATNNGEARGGRERQISPVPGYHSLIQLHPHQTPAILQWTQSQLITNRKRVPVYAELNSRYNPVSWYCARGGLAWCAQSLSGIQWLDCYWHEAVDNQRTFPVWQHRTSCTTTGSNADQLSHSHSRVKDLFLLE